jgi:hypothetical protein
VKTYQTVGEVLDFVRSAHRRMADVCRKLSEQSGSEKTKLLMDVFADHEDELQRVLGGEGAEQRQDVLETWIQYVPARPIEVILDELESREGLAWDDISQAILRLQEAIAQLWIELAQQVEAPIARETLGALAEAEQEMNRRLSQQILSFQEM